jgi:hypothetical protein
MNEDTKRINELNWGYRASRVLHVANELDIFTVLGDGDKTSDEISEACGSLPDMTQKLLIACAAMGLVEKRGDAYRNTELASNCLVRGRPQFQGDMIAHSAAVWDFWQKLPQAVKSGAARPDFTPDRHRSFILAMHNTAMAGRVQLFLEHVDLTGRRRLFDVGGGPATYSIMACKRYTKLEATVFDIPETIAVTQERIAAERMQAKVHVKEGSWDTDDFGRDNDVVLLSDVMHGPPSNTPMKLKKAFDSMTAGGLLVIQEFLLNDEKTGPLICALFNMMVGAWSRSELLSLVTNAGFKAAKIVASDDQLGSSWLVAAKP